METLTKEQTAGDQTPAVASTTVKKKVKEETAIRYKDITLKAARTFVTLPKGVQEETRTRIGAFAKEGEPIAFRALSEKELKIYGPTFLGSSPTAPDFQTKVNTYFNDFAINIPFEEGIKITTPVDKNDEVVLTEETSKFLTDIMRYRHVMEHPRVAKSYAQYEEAPQFYLAYIIDRRVLKKEQISGKEVRKQADKLYLELSLEENATKLMWVLELARRGVATGNLSDPPEGYVPSSLRGVLNVTNLDMDERELAIEEFKVDRPEAFVDLNKDSDLEWRALLERLVTLGVLVREGNVIMNENEAVGGSDSEAIARMKTDEYSKALVVLKQKMKNKSQTIK